MRLVPSGGQESRQVVECGRREQGRVAQAPSKAESRVRLGLVGGYGGDGEKYPLKFPPPCVWRPVHHSASVCCLPTYGFLGTFETFTPEASAQAMPQGVRPSLVVCASFNQKYRATAGE